MLALINKDAVGAHPNSVGTPFAFNVVFLDDPDLSAKLYLFDLRAAGIGQWPVHLWDAWPWIALAVYA